MRPLIRLLELAAFSCRSSGNVLPLTTYISATRCRSLVFLGKILPFLHMNGKILPVRGSRNPQWEFLFCPVHGIIKRERKRKGFTEPALNWPVNGSLIEEVRLLVAGRHLPAQALLHRFAEGFAPLTVVLPRLQSRRLGSWNERPK